MNIQSLLHYEFGVIDKKDYIYRRIWIFVSLKVVFLNKGVCSLYEKKSENRIQIKYVKLQDGLKSDDAFSTNNIDRTKYEKCSVKVHSK